MVLTNKKYAWTEDATTMAELAEDSLAYGLEKVGLDIDSEDPPSKSEIELVRTHHSVDIVNVDSLFRS